MEQGARAQLNGLSAIFGLCIPIADLKAPSSPLALALHVGEYRPFYLMRDEDAVAQGSLHDHSGLLVSGLPFSGKTRMALQAMLEVVPDGILLRFRTPACLARLEELAIPSFTADGGSGKPAVVVFFDDIDRFEGAPFDGAIDRLSSQVSRLYVVATCRTGSTRRIISSESLKNLRAGPLSPSRIVEIRPLTPVQAMQVEKEVWKTDPGRDLGLDRSTVGTILLGTKILGSDHGPISDAGAQILHGLFLSERFASPCPKDLLKDMVESVIRNGALASFDASLDALVEADLVQRDDQSRLSIVSHHHRDRVVAAHYTSMTALRADLRRAEAVLEKRRDTAYLTLLATYYGDRLGDLGEARRLLERILKLDSHPDALLYLSLIIARSGELDAAQAALEKCLAAVAERNSQANALIRFGDELLQKLGSAAARPFYARAVKLAELEATELAATNRFGDVCLAEDEYAKAESIYRDIIGKTADDVNQVVVGRYVVAIAAQGDRQRAARELLGRLEGRPQELKNSIAVAVLENGERRFASSAEKMEALLEIVWEASREAAPAETRAAELPAFAGQMLAQGFLSMARLAYTELWAMRDGLNLDPKQKADLLNALATSHLYLRDAARARPLFEETLSLLRANAGTHEVFVAAAEDGLAVCDILEGKLQSARKRYEELFRLGKRIDNDSITVWANIYLGHIAWKEGNPSAARDHFGAIRTIPADFELVVQFDLGMARVCLHYGLPDNADFHIARGLASCVRADYAYLRPDFESLKKQLVAARATGEKPPAPAMPAVVALEALIMKGGGVKGLAFAGAIRELERHFQFKTYVGTSAGSIAAALLAAGATGARLEAMLRPKAFREFLDGSWWRLLTSRGMHPGISFMDWLREQLYALLPKVGGNLELRDFRGKGNRAVIYASSSDHGVVVFDSSGQRADARVHFAVRCSMSIPYFFQPQMLDTSHVYDGGLLNNYPVEIFLNDEIAKSPQKTAPTFIALWLGSPRPAPLKKRLVISELLSILIERNDVEVVNRYIKDTVVIDTRPVGTIDFDLTDEEKDFLVLAGRAAALEFLQNRGVLDESRLPDVRQTRADAEKLRMKVWEARGRRWPRRWLPERWFEGPPGADG